MRYKPFAFRGAVLAGITGAILAVTPAAAQSNYGQTPQTPTTSPSNTGEAGNMGNTGAMGSQQAEQPADQISDPTSKLATDTVQDSSGQTVGTVRSVRTGAGGKASRINVSLTRSGRTVSIRASELRFDPASNTLKSSLTLSQITAMPATQSP